MATIKELRLKKLWSQAKLAKLSGVSRTTIVAIENNHHAPQPLTIHKLARALEVEPSQIAKSSMSPRLGFWQPYQN